MAESTFPNTGLSAFEYKQLVEWMKNPNRKPAYTAFTVGACRDAARAFEEFIRDAIPVHAEKKPNGEVLAYNVKIQASPNAILFIFENPSI